MGKRQKRTTSQKKLLKYFAYEAEDMGKAGEDAVAKGRCYPDGQAFYSLLWYYQHCIEDDLDSSKPGRFSPLLDAYFGGEHPEIINPLVISKKQIAKENKLLEECFPQSEFPLNKRQVESVHKALHYPISIIKGPPGTGKTEVILRIAALAACDGQSVVAVSANNSAVENIEEKLDGALACYGDLNLEMSREHSKTDLMFALACKHVKLGSKDVRSRAADPVTNSNFAFDAASNKGTHVFPDGGSLIAWEQNKHLEEFTKEHPFITSSIHSLKKCFLDGDVEKYDLLIMDEASQTNLVVGIVAMSCAKRVVIVGDEQQLPPVITDVHIEHMKRYAKKQRLFEKGEKSPYDVSRDGQSFLSSCYEVFSDRNPDLLTMLNEHFRCHPAIIGFCNQEIYEEKLKICSRPGNADITCPIRICWYEGDYREGMWPPAAPVEESPDKKHRTTYVNRKQLLILEQEEAAHLKDLVSQKKSICILSPFKGQIYSLAGSVRRILGKAVDEKDISFETYTSEEDEQQEGAPSKPNQPICSLTIHKSQGREFDIVYLLPVEDGDWEWPWSQGRRLVNVAASRAKEELNIIVSTKLMEGKTQELLAGRRVYVPKPARAEDDKKQKQMFVRKLVEYVRTVAPTPILEEAGHVVQKDPEKPSPDSQYGFHRTVVTSIFDGIPFKQGAKKDKEFAPELCVLEAIEAMNLPGISYSQNVSFNHLKLPDGRLVSKACEDSYACPDEVHFDFVLYDTASRRVIMAIEVDGPQHRFKRSHGMPDNTQREMDITKDRVAQDICKAESCWLGAIKSGSLAPQVQVDEGLQDESLPMQAEMDAPDQNKKELWPDWKRFPSQMTEASSFVYLRMPSDGSTFWETDALRNWAMKTGANKTVVSKKCPPTIEEYVRKQLILDSRGDQSRFVYAAEKIQGASMGEGDVSAILDAQKASGDASIQYGPIFITNCLEEWRKQPELAAKLARESPATMNEHLEKAGFNYCAGGDSHHRFPTDKGKRIGISLFHGTATDDEYDAPVYSAQARAYIAAHIDEILAR